MKNSSNYLIEQSTLYQYPLEENTKFANKQVKGRFYKPINVNLGDTQYSIIQQVCDQLGWRIIFNEGKSWDIKWTDSAVTSEYLAKMFQHQKVNHFPGMNVLSRKNNLTKNIMRMQNQFQNQYNFYPKTFLLPFDTNKLKYYNQQQRRNGFQNTFIVKPQASSQGRGIYLTQDLNEIDIQSHCVVQKYITNPLLYKGLKFDLRVYALIASCDPLRIYIYNQGLTRFATQKYSQPSEQNIDNLYMHLTNYAINKDHPNYVYNNSIQNLSYGHKKSLAEFFQTLKNMGLKAHQFWTDIKQIIVKTMITGQPHLQHQYRMSQPRNIAADMCFQVLGFDFMFDTNNKCHLLQINHTPSFTTDTPLDQLVKSNLIRDSLNLMNINPQSRDRKLVELIQEQDRRVFTGKRLVKTPEQRKKIAQQIQKQRDQYQINNLGSYQRIYPSKNLKKQKLYQQLSQYSLQSYKQSTGFQSKHSPAKFRVKKLISNHIAQNQVKTENHLHNLSSIKRQQPFINRNISTSIDSSSRRIQSSINKQVSKNKNSQRFTDKIIALKSKEMNEKEMNEELIQNEQKSLGMTQQKKQIKRKNDNLTQIQQGNRPMWAVGGFLKTRQEQTTMFNKLINSKN